MKKFSFLVPLTLVLTLMLISTTLASASNFQPQTQGIVSSDAQLASNSDVALIRIPPISTFPCGPQIIPLPGDNNQFISKTPSCGGAGCKVCLYELVDESTRL